MPKDSTRHVPSYRHHRHSGRAYVELSGKRLYLGRYDTAESRQRYHRLLGAHGRQQT